MDKTEYAHELHTSGFNCAQSVFATFAEDYGLSLETALKIASGLGGGVRCGGTCGAITGAALVIGLKNGQAEAQDLQSKEHCNKEITEFVHHFREYNGALNCHDILGVDISEDEGRKYALEHNLFHTVCADMVTSAVEILEDMGY